MENTYTKELHLLPGSCDYTGRLGVANTFTLFMDIANEHAELLDIGMLQMAARHQFWLTVRTRIRFYNCPKLNTLLTLSTWPGVPGKVRCQRYYTLEASGERLADGRTEWAILDTDLAKIVPCADAYPAQLQPRNDTVCDAPNAVIRDIFTDNTELARCQIGSMEIDIGEHMNNASYVRMLLNTFSTKELSQLHIREMEIIFRSPSFEGETLSIRRVQTETGMDMAMLHADGKPAVLARLVTAE